MPRKPPVQLERADLAYENEPFLNGPDGRIIRILAEYSEPLARFRRERIQDTVCSSGRHDFARSTRPIANWSCWKTQARNSRLPKKSSQHGRQSTGKRANLRRRRAEAAVEMAAYYEDARNLALLLTQWAKDLNPAVTVLWSPRAEAPALWRPPTAAPGKRAAKPSD